VRAWPQKHAFTARGADFGCLGWRTTAMSLGLILLTAIVAWFLARGVRKAGKSQSVDVVHDAVLR